MNTASAVATEAVSTAKRKPLLANIGLDQIGEARLENRNLAAIKRRDLLRVLVDAGHVVAEIGKAGAGHQPHITCADHGHAHRFFVPS